MPDIVEDTPRLWSKADIIEFLGSSQGREMVCEIVQEALAHHEPIKEGVARVAIEARGQVMSRSLEEIEQDLEIEEPLLPCYDATSVGGD